MAHCCFRLPASSCRSRPRGGLSPASRSGSAAVFRQPPTCWARIRRSFATPGCPGGRSATIRQLAERLSDGRLDPDGLAALPDDELISLLSEIPGIGPWTAQGALIIALGREDVVLPGDLALRKAVRATYRLDHLPAEEEVLGIAEKWRPYRSLATAYLFSAAFEEAQAPGTVV